MSRSSTLTGRRTPFPARGYRRCSKASSSESSSEDSSIYLLRGSNVVGAISSPPPDVVEFTELVRAGVDDGIEERGEDAVDGFGWKENFEDGSLFRSSGNMGMAG